MAEKLEAQATTSGANPKFVLIRRSDGAFWNTSGTPAFEAYSVGSIASYGITATETGATGIFTATNPSPTTEAFYRFVLAAGASLAATDLATGVRWTGAAGPQNADTTLIEGLDATTQLAASGGGGTANETTSQQILRVVQAQGDE